MRLGSIPTVAAALLLFLCIGSQPACAGPLWPEQEQRLNIGLKLFPAALGALENLADKVGVDDRLLVVVVHDDLNETARLATDQLRNIKTIRGLSLRVLALSAAALDVNKQEPVAGIFVASPDLGAKRLRSLAERFRTLVFSPFIGEVEDGAVAGVHVADRILPFVNLTQADRAGVRFKSFFMKVARVHE